MHQNIIRLIVILTYVYFLFVLSQPFNAWSLCLLARISVVASHLLLLRKKWPFATSLFFSTPKYVSNKCFSIYELSMTFIIPWQLKLFHIPVLVYEAGNVIHQDVHIGSDLCRVIIIFLKNKCII